jgi:UPF0716 protein FxsA
MVAPRGPGRKKTAGIDPPPAPCYDPRMQPAKAVLRLLDRNFVTKLLILGLLYSLVPLAEIFLLIYLGNLIGYYFTLALAAFAGLVGMLAALREFRKNLQALRKKTRRGVLPTQEFINLTGVLAASVLLLTPGFITDTLGFLLFVPAVRNALGRWVLSKTRTDLKELYEYLKLEES